MSVFVLDDFIGPTAARVVRWLNAHWEWYFVLALATFVVFALTHTEAHWVQFVMIVACIPHPGTVMIGAAITSATRLQITMRVWAWVGYAVSTTIFIMHDGNRTIADVWDYNMRGFDNLTAHAVELGLGREVSFLCAAGVYALIFVAIPVGLFIWTRWARLNPHYDTTEQAPAR